MKDRHLEEIFDECTRWPQDIRMARQRPGEDTRRLTEAVAEAGMMELFEVDGALVWRHDGQTVGVGRNWLHEIVTKLIVDGAADAVRRGRVLSVRFCARSRHQQGARPVRSLTDPAERPEIDGRERSEPAGPSTAAACTTRAAATCDGRAGPRLPKRTRLTSIAIPSGSWRALASRL